MYMKQPSFFFPFTLRTTKSSTVKQRVHTCTVSGTGGKVGGNFVYGTVSTNKWGGYRVWYTVSATRRLPRVHTCNLATNAWGHHVPCPKQTDSYYTDRLLIMFVETPTCMKMNPYPNLHLILVFRNDWRHVKATLSSHVWTNKAMKSLRYMYRELQVRCSRKCYWTSK